MSRSYKDRSIRTIPYHPMDRRSALFYKRQAAKRFRRFERRHRESNLDGAVYRQVYNSWMIKEFRWRLPGRWVKPPRGKLPGGYKRWIKWRSDSGDMNELDSSAAPIRGSLLMLVVAGKFPLAQILNRPYPWRRGRLAWDTLKAKR